MKTTGNFFGAIK